VGWSEVGLEGAWGEMVRWGLRTTRYFCRRAGDASTHEQGTGPVGGLRLECSAAGPMK
jgi:hypothetical protein